ncbi:MAG: hypothetical protein NQ127_00465 [Candidatus Cardinium sp.]|nr:hypothetical protein [Candidatus Cardinium sp.]
MKILKEKRALWESYVYQQALMKIKDNGLSVCLASSKDKENKCLL